MAKKLKENIKIHIIKEKYGVPFPSLKSEHISEKFNSIKFSPIKFCPEKITSIKFSPIKKLNSAIIKTSKKNSAKKKM